MAWGLSYSWKYLRIATPLRMLQQNCVCATKINMIYSSIVFLFGVPHYRQSTGLIWFERNLNAESMVFGSKYGKILYKWWISQLRLITPQGFQGRNSPASSQKLPCAQAPRKQEQVTTSLAACPMRCKDLMKTQKGFAFFPATNPRWWLSLPIHQSIEPVFSMFNQRRWFCWEKLHRKPCVFPWYMWV